MSPGIENTSCVPTTSFISHASEILNNMNLPPEHLKEVITAQFATCKKFRNQLVLTMWELEESKRWTKVVKCTLSAVWQDHTAAQAALQNWLESVEKKLDEVSQAQSSSKYGKQQEMLCFVRAKFEDWKDSQSLMGWQIRTLP
ncbi:hypothetical protein BDR07DRAFT_1386460 [Suillus spraguei]|nr:hypothetical protein BDR07DRAFT_1386460 [Suillus spraguei]